MLVGTKPFFKQLKTERFEKKPDDSVTLSTTEYNLKKKNQIRISCTNPCFIYWNELAETLLELNLYFG